MNGPNLQSQSMDERTPLEQRFRSGDDDAFDEVVECYTPAVQQLVHRLSGWQCDCDDLVQDVFVAALANRRKFKGTSLLKTWLFAIAVNRCRLYHRRQILWGRLRRQLVFRGPPPEKNSEEDKNQQRTEQIQKALQRLPGKYRDVLVLKYLEELPTQEIVDILKISESAFYTRLNRAKKQLQEKLLPLMERENE